MPRNRIIYRSNGIISGLHNNGKKTQDSYTCGKTYQNFLVTDDYGVSYDNRRADGGDINQKEGASPAIGVSPYLTAGGAII
jgi:hypothetical protein